MDPVAKLITQFISEDSTNFTDIDQSRNNKIIETLETYVDDERVLDFFLKVSADEAEYDLARIEVFKILEITHFKDEETRRRIAKTIHDVLEKSKDELVRSYAAMTIGRFLDIDEIFDYADKALRDSAEDENVRSSLFAAFWRIGPESRTIETMKFLLRDREFLRSAQRVLGEWNISVG